MSSTLFNLTEATSLISGDAFYLVRGADTAGNDRFFTLATLEEHVQDLMASTLVAGSNISVVYNDAGGTITISYTGATPAATTDDLPEGAANFYFHGLSGDVTVTAAAGPGAAAATIANDAVTNAKLANMAQATIKGRASGAGTGDPTDLTPEQVRGVVSVREALLANRTYYVNSATGNDSNDGLSTGTAWQTLQKALDAVATIDFNGFNLTIECATGSTFGAVTLKPGIGSGALQINGTGCAISAASGACVTQRLPNSHSITMTGFTVTGGASFGYDISGGGTGLIILSPTIGNITVAWFIARNFAYIQPALTTITVTGSTCTQPFAASSGGRVNSFGSTVNHTVPFTTGFAYAFADTLAHLIAGSMVFTGSAVAGTRYRGATNSVIQVDGGGASYFPGTVAGTTATGSQYV